MNLADPLFAEEGALETSSQPLQRPPLQSGLDLREHWDGTAALFSKCHAMWPKGGYLWVFLLTSSSLYLVYDVYVWMPNPQRVSDEMSYLLATKLGEPVR